MSTLIHRCLLNPIMLSPYTGYHFYSVLFYAFMVSFWRKKYIYIYSDTYMHIHFAFFLLMPFSSLGSTVITNSDLTIVFVNFSYSKRLKFNYTNIYTFTC